ncbi:MAG: hypothetical protein ACI9UJ_002112 [bacterium]|jgi:hypothetical protein
MQNIMYLFPLLLGFVILLGTTAALVKHLAKTKKPAWMRFGIIGLALFMAFGLYKGVYKPYGLYQNHYKQATGMPFPTLGEYVFADTWIDNPESDGYSSIALITLPYEETKQLKNRLTSIKYGALTDSIKAADGLYDRINYALALSTVKEIELELGVVEKRKEIRNGTMFKIDKIRYYFGFLADGETVIVYIISN